ncbi:protein phosphatase 2C domain-containing protein [Nonomuraea sp. PA05]|uniref:protein phosphatase 2C domain-containing protein n=1 Tax=Nonomuraea sp. PA05 TaxID=2604466 RepID=UPI0011D55B07|nr:protein phosphatase 2C domain-containing protein [Nonomuraea sp. PA05]TYB54740.1 protein phosphatase 2C domain-containing protein [Nonomuraea sp. PA05]
MDTRGDPRVAASPFDIGNPGRAGRELPAGPPGPHPGLPDVGLSAVSLPGVLIRAATIRGLRHRSRAEARQDAYALGQFERPCETTRAIAVVCDGIGSLGRSHEAAEMVSRRLVELSQTGGDWPVCVDKANQELRAHAELVLTRPDADPAADGMATTMVALSIGWTGGEWIGELAWVGDSALLWLTPERRWLCLTDQEEEDPDGFHTTKVRPLPNRDGSCRTRPVRLNGGALFLMTDGIANPLRWAREVQEALADWWTAPPDPFTFAAQAAFSRKSHLDDRTVVAFWPDPGLPDGEASP